MGRPTTLLPAFVLKGQGFTPAWLKLRRTIKPSFTIPHPLPMVHPRLSRMDQFHPCRDTHKVIWAVGMSDAFVRVGVKPSKDHNILSWRERDHIFGGKNNKKKQAMFNCYRYSEISAWSRGKVAKTYDKVPKGTWVPWVTMPWVTVAASAQHQSRIGAHFEPASWQGISPNDSTSVLRGFAVNPSFPQVQKGLKCAVPLCRTTVWNQE